MGGRPAGEGRGGGGGGGAAGEDEYRSAALNARELEWAVNPPEVWEAHKQANENGKIIRTRFPPEPNGYLHIGHAKSMNMNFRLAFEKLGVPVEHRRTNFRYDDTNPEAESAEYIDSLRRDVEWMGWTPACTVYASDYFPQLYEFAIELIKKGLAYVCDMSKAEMEIQRELAMKRNNARQTGKDPDVMAPIPSPDILPGRNRNTSVERNLEMFEKMKLGFFEEGQYTLRLKMDFDSPNPNMYDLVAYRIKYTAHPHCGSGWCIYPAYDFTHGICDSLEHVDYSICTLEFEVRREPYYWILWALNLFRPKVYEMSRLNVQYTVLSKRRLIKLVETNFVRGWDDPRMPTISGLRRRGYTADILNTFCHELGVTRAANVVEISKLEQTARLKLSATSRRAMAALDPILVELSNYESEVAAAAAAAAGGGGPVPSASSMTFPVQNSPTDVAAGSHDITLTSSIYIDASDFRLDNYDDPQYYGLGPGKTVGLKYYGGNLICDHVVCDDVTKKVVKLIGRLDLTPDRPKPKTFISWVPANSLPCELRVYSHLFVVPEPTDLWEDELNRESELVYPNALLDPSVSEVIDVRNIDPWKSNAALQLERFGYFVVDFETTYSAETNPTGRIVLNRTVSLKEETFKRKLNADEEARMEARRQRDKKEMEAKQIRMKIEPKDLFKLAEEYQGKFSKFDDSTGLPTHDAEGNEVTKSALKKLVKEQQKHAKQLESWKKTNSNSNNS